jgi:DNA-binding transcriptional regulator YiaG
MTDMAEITPEWIFDLRKNRLGMTQIKFAEELGVSHPTVCHWENGVRSPSGSAKILLMHLAAKAELREREKISA